MATPLTVETPTVRLSVPAGTGPAVVPIPIVLILILQAAASTFLLHNTASQPEALYIFAGKELIRGLAGEALPSSNYATYFSGYPYFYPPLAGMLDQLGGLEVVRFFSTMCMLITTTCVYSITRRLYSQTCGYVAALLFACLAPTLYLSRLATYDALALMLLAIATVVAFHVSTARGPAGAIVLAPLFVLAVAAKYAALLYVPFIIGLMALRTYEQRDWRRAVMHVSLTLITLAWIIWALSPLITPDVLAGLGFTTTNRTAMGGTTTRALFGIILSLGGPIWALSLLGVALSSKRRRLLALALLLASIAAPAYHLRIGEVVSIQKHVDYGLFFVMPLASYAVTTFSSRAIPHIQSRWIVCVLFLLVLVGMTVNESQWWYHTWPDSSQLVATMRTQVGGASSRYLCEDFEVLEYYLSDVTSGRQFTGPYAFAYADADGNRYSGEEAYIAAIKAGYFNVVELNFSHRVLDNDLLATLNAQSQYQLVARLPWSDSYGSYDYMVWAKRGT